MPLKSFPGAPLIHHVTAVSILGGLHASPHNASIKRAEAGKSSFAYLHAGEWAGWGTAKDVNAQPAIVGLCLFSGLSSGRLLSSRAPALGCANKAAGGPFVGADQPWTRGLSLFSSPPTSASPQRPLWRGLNPISIISLLLRLLPAKVEASGRAQAPELTSLACHHRAWLAQRSGGCGGGITPFLTQRCGLLTLLRLLWCLT